MVMFRFVLILTSILVFVSGCSGNYGKIKRQTGDGKNITLTELRDNWDEYEVYFSMRSNRYADAIIFDPKNSGTKISGDSWIEIEDQKALDQRISNVDLMYRHADVHVIEGADDRFFGYIYYSGYFHVAAKIVDEQTLYMMPLPKYKSTP